MSIDHVEVTADTAHWMKSQGWSYVMSTQHEEELRYAIQDARDEYPQHALHVTLAGGRVFTLWRCAA